MSTVQPKNVSDASLSLNKSCFYRTYSLWNTLPFEIREIGGPSAFKNEVIKYFWKLLLMDDSDIYESDVYLSDSD